MVGATQIRHELWWACCLGLLRVPWGIGLHVEGAILRQWGCHLRSNKRAVLQSERTMYSATRYQPPEQLKSPYLGFRSGVRPYLCSLIKDNLMSLKEMRAR